MVLLAVAVGAAWAMCHWDDIDTRDRYNPNTGDETEG
jgi:hypothetical protein